MGLGREIVMADDEGVTSLEYGGHIASLVTVAGAAEVVPWGIRVCAVQSDPRRMTGMAIRGRSQPSWVSDTGAAAVEFALILPLLLLVLFGIIDFGRALNNQITLTQAAREGVRVAALRVTAPLDPGAQALLAGGWSVTDVPPVTVTVTSCGVSGSDARVVVARNFTFATPVGAIAGLFGVTGPFGTIPMTGIGVMRCG